MLKRNLFDPNQRIRLFKFLEQRSTTTVTRNNRWMCFHCRRTLSKCSKCRMRLIGPLEPGELSDPQTAQPLNPNPTEPNFDVKLG
jgi:hypothetical protein